MNTMAAQERNFCCGCLLEGRKLRPLQEFWIKQCFLQIISEIPMCQPEDVPICLCWECEALVRRFTEFKQQVKYSYTTLQEYGEWKPDIKLSRTPKLKVHNQFNINYPDIEEGIKTNTDTEQPLSLTVEIKQETTKQVKSEIESISDHDYDDDNLLISYVTKKKKAVKRKKKKLEPCKEMEPIETQTEKLYKEIELTESEIEEERRDMGMRDEYVNAMFRCEKCIMSFPNADDLKDHTAVKHELNAAHHVCPICTCSFVSEISYNYHTNKHKRRYDCYVCNLRFRSKRAAQKHYETTHGIDPTYENHDGRENQTENATNTNEVKSEGTFPCEQCAKTFRWKTSLRKHLEKHRIDAGQKRRPYCEPCKLSFTTTSNLQKHVKTSSKHQIQLKLRKLKDTLPEDATTPEKQQAHIEEIKCSVNSSRQQYPCAHCGKRFQWRGNLLRHLHSHAARANGELVCTPCNRTFSSLATYKQHMRLSRAHVSEQEFPHQCSECGRRFANKTRLKDHVDWDHRRHFAHHCTQCQKAYKQHMRLSRAHVSEQEFPHECPECGRRFANKTRLKDHVDWDHKRHFAHHCTQCQKVFKSHTSLYLHKQVVHKKENAEHLCDHCGKPFPNHAKLRSHIIALHTSESPYKCTSCAARFSWHSCLSRHVRRVHKRK